jgi:arylsulfatase
VLDTLDEIGQTHNTLVIWEIGDNGASMEGTLSGAFNELATLQGIPEDPAFLLKHIDELGSAKASNHIPVGWAWAVNTPFQWGKQVASPHQRRRRHPHAVPSRHRHFADDSRSRPAAPAG